MEKEEKLPLRKWITIFLLSLFPPAVLGFAAYSLTYNIKSALILFFGVYLFHFGLHALVVYLFGEGKWSEYDEVISYLVVAMLSYIATGSLGWAVVLTLFYLSFNLIAIGGFFELMKRGEHQSR